jgi:aminoglycoside phosphotransferase (APT) family kinase protein
VRLDAGIVSELVAAQFPDLAGAQVRRFAAGWDHDLFSVGAEWILRFPKRAERVAWLAREIQINTIAAETLGSGIPVFERIGTPSAIFAYPFVGYRRLPGAGADQAGARDLGGLADDVGRLLGKLHRIDPRRIPPTPAGWEHETWAELRTGLAAAGQVIRPLLAPGLLAKAGPYLAGRVPEPAQDGPRRFIHNDICPDHLIVNARTGRLAGLIGIGGYEFISQVVSSYDLPVGSGFGRKLRWLARTLTLAWLAEAADHDPGGIPKHLSWVARAFGH